MTRMMKLALLMVTGALMQVLALPAHSLEPFVSCDKLAGQWRDVTGLWVATTGPIDLQVDESRVNGVYNNGKWRLELTYSPDKRQLFGVWDHRDGVVGPVVFFLDEWGCIETAKWGSGVGPPPYGAEQYAASINGWTILGRMATTGK